MGNSRFRKPLIYLVYLNKRTLVKKTIYVIMLDILIDTTEEYEMGKISWKPSRGELVIAISVGVCFLFSFIPKFQAVTAAITTLLVGQTSDGIEWRTGMKRIAGTALGGIVGVLVAAVEVFFHAKGLSLLLVFAGMLMTIVGCRVLRMPLYSDRVGGITFILVSMSEQGTERIPYAIFRLLSTLAGVLIWLAVACVFSAFLKRKREAVY